MSRKVVARIRARIAKRQAISVPDPNAPLTREQIAALPPLYPRPEPRTAKERMEQKLGPDDGRRRGGRPTVQGGGPGLGKRR